METKQEYDGVKKAVNTKIHYLFQKKNSSEISEKDKNTLQTSINKNQEAEKNQTQKLYSVNEITISKKPNIPVYFIRPNSIKKAAKFFLDNFKNEKLSAEKSTDILYSVKSNPDKEVLKHLFASGIKHFDVASLAEVKLINSLFGNQAKMYFMHPIKSREAIYQSYFNYGIRNFSLDSLDELKKILEVTNNAKDLGLHVRLAISNSHAAFDLSGKFGILPSEATNLVRKVRMAAKTFGICFHVGSQCMDPIEYRNALTITKEVLDKAKVKADVIDVGGGFPSSYPSLSPIDMESYFSEIFSAINQLGFADCKIWCEPGRALVAEAGSLLVKVEGRKKSMLYINDGTYGGLFDAGHPGFIYPVRAIRVKGRKNISEKMLPFGFYGPTCDSLDTMKGPFYLPEDIAEGDYIEIGQLGAYSRSIRTEFNGFNENIQIEVCDEPLISMYNKQNNSSSDNLEKTENY
jgi:ornithine decarboxylase